MTKRIMFLFFITLAMQACLFADKQRIAISKFESDDENTAKIAEFFEEGLEEGFVNERLVNVVERTQIDKVIQEQKIQLTGLTDQTSAVKIGKILNVSKIILGKVSHIQSLVTIRLKVVSVESAEVCFNQSVSVDFAKANAKKAFEEKGAILVQNLITEVTGEEYKITNKKEMSEIKDITITIVSARDVFSSDILGNSDVFAEVYVGDQFLGTTSIISEAINPVWNQPFNFLNYKGEKVKVIFYDSDVTKNELLGGFIFDNTVSGEYEIIQKRGNVSYSYGYFTIRFTFV
jgi:hypothetical protein